MRWRDDKGAEADGEFLSLLLEGGQLIHGGDVKSARAKLEQAVRLRPQNEKARDLLGQSYFKLGQYDAALATYQTLTDDNPEEPALRMNLGLVLIKMGDLQNARLQLEYVHHLKPNHPKALGYLGVVYQKLGEFRLAKWAFELAGNDKLAREMATRLAQAADAADAEDAEDAAEVSDPPQAPPEQPAVPDAVSPIPQDAVLLPQDAVLLPQDDFTEPPLPRDEPLAAAATPAPADAPKAMDLGSNALGFAPSSASMHAALADGVLTPAQWVQRRGLSWPHASVGLAAPGLLAFAVEDGGWVARNKLVLARGSVLPDSHNANNGEAGMVQCQGAGQLVLDVGGLAVGAVLLAGGSLTVTARAFLACSSGVAVRGAGRVGTEPLWQLEGHGVVVLCAATTIHALVNSDAAPLQVAVGHLLAHDQDVSLGTVTEAGVGGGHTVRVRGTGTVWIATGMKAW
jgi:Flp pilus assembly protein TadD